MQSSTESNLRNSFGRLFELDTDGIEISQRFPSFRPERIASGIYWSLRVGFFSSLEHRGCLRLEQEEKSRQLHLQLNVPLIQIAPGLVVQRHQLQKLHGALGCTLDCANQEATLASLLKIHSHPKWPTDDLCPFPQGLYATSVHMVISSSRPLQLALPQQMSFACVLPRAVTDNPCADCCKPVSKASPREFLSTCSDPRKDQPAECGGKAACNQAGHQDISDLDLAQIPLSHFAPVTGIFNREILP
ncbi:hypothetical protein DFO63_0277 [Stenotrophomonas sp. AG209]|nr:hypothetical protein DFO63_0277 [Stenotrophomonas sp. AG209]